MQVRIPKQQNLPIKFHKYKKAFSKIPQKEKRFIPSRSQSCRSPLSPKKNKATAFSFLQSRGEPRYSLSSFALAVALLPRLQSKATHHERGESKDSRFACNIDSMDSANAESQANNHNKVSLRLRHDLKRVK
ncbi:hypothetical protein T36_2164 [Helicobacter cinaedi]|uniref:hypothetical protein n=1 Tax=Helicobacter cinaedi TaxID=213 RepID=UPI001F38FD3A|nr:hypothetical protein [Helicobacter cinaedi]BDB65685.1 hypothetical protein T36_2164 [Helicobacter cinaedi]